MGDVRKAIKEVKREQRKQYVFVVLVIVIILSVLWFRGPVDTQVISYTSPASLSYELPEMSQPNLILTQQKFISASCDDSGAITCTEPTVLSFFVQNIDTGIGRYEYSVHMRLRNNGEDASNVKPSIEFENAPCAFGGQPFSLGSGATSGRLDFICVAKAPLEEQTATLTIAYNDGIDKQVQTTIKLR